MFSSLLNTAAVLCSDCFVQRLFHSKEGEQKLILPLRLVGWGDLLWWARSCRSRGLARRSPSRPRTAPEVAAGRTSGPQSRSSFLPESTETKKMVYVKCCNLIQLVYRKLVLTMNLLNFVQHLEAIYWGTLRAFDIAHNNNNQSCFVYIVLWNEWFGSNVRTIVIWRLFDHSIIIDHINRLFDAGVHSNSCGTWQRVARAARSFLQAGCSARWVWNGLAVTSGSTGGSAGACGSSWSFFKNSLEAKVWTAIRATEIRHILESPMLMNGDANGDDSKFKRLTHEEEYYMW